MHNWFGHCQAKRAPPVPRLRCRRQPAEQHAVHTYTTVHTYAGRAGTHRPPPPRQKNTMHNTAADQHAPNTQAAVPPYNSCNGLANALVCAAMHACATPFTAAHAVTCPSRPEGRWHPARNGRPALTVRCTVFPDLPMASRHLATIHPRHMRCSSCWNYAKLRERQTSQAAAAAAALRRRGEGWGLREAHGARHPPAALFAPCTPAGKSACTLAQSPRTSTNCAIEGSKRAPPHRWQCAAHTAAAACGARSGPPPPPAAAAVHLPADRVPS